MFSSSAERLITGASAAVALAAVVARVHAAVAFPPIRDFDASGHAVNVVDLLEGHLPHVRSWCGSHPPLYYGIGAALWAWVPASVPVHVMLRLVAIAAFAATVALVWRTLRRLGAGVDAGVVAALLLGVPGFAITSGMMTNDALCALFVTATLVRLLPAADAPAPGPRHAALTGLLAGLAALTKATGVAVVGFAAAHYAWRARAAPRRALSAVAACVLASAAVAAWHYVRLFLELTGSPYDILGARAGSEEKEAIATIVDTVTRLGTRAGSRVALLHAAVWGDPTAVYLPRDLQTHPLARALAAGGLLVTGIAAAGAVRVATERALLARVAPALAFGAAYALALVPHALSRPYVVLTKTNYLLLEALPLGLVLALGLGWAGVRGVRTALRAAALLVAAAGVALTTHGWWDAVAAPGPVAADAAAPADAATPADPAAALVARYFHDRAHDPIRALGALAPAVHEAHGLRLTDLLGLGPLAAAPGPDPEDARALELARARVAWLELSNLVRWLQPIAAGLDVRVLEVRDAGATAAVVVRIAAAGATAPAGGALGLWPFPPFTQQLTVADVGGGRRIVRVEQDGVVGENAVPAFVAHPTRAGFERLRAIGWEPPWQRAIAAALAAPR